MDVAALITEVVSQPTATPLSRRYGTVLSVGDTTLSVLVDGATEPITVGRFCSPDIGKRVMLLVYGTNWAAIATAGGDGGGTTATPVTLTTNGSATVFTVDGMTDDTPVTVLLNGVVQLKDSDYNRSGTTLTTTLGYAVPAGQSLIVVLDGWFL